jgi:hypothetical protein
MIRLEAREDTAFTAANPHIGNPGGVYTITFGFSMSATNPGASANLGLFRRDRLRQFGPDLAADA